MEECDYCGASFEGEDAYVDHLQSEHDGELSRIDQKRVERERGGGDTAIPTGALLGVGGLLVLAGIVYFVFFSGGGGGGAAGPVANDATPEGIEAESLSDQGNQTLLSDVESFDGLSRNHVSDTVDYERNPPVGGDHWGSTAEVGYYTQTPRLEELVHNLEHGHVVVYYDPDSISDDAEQSLKEFAAAHTDGWAAVVVVPNPRDDPKANYVLTAWGHRLRMDDYDPRTVQAFLAEYIGRGPENPVR